MGPHVLFKNLVGSLGARVVVLHFGPFFGRNLLDLLAELFVDLDTLLTSLFDI